MIEKILSILQRRQRSYSVTINTISGKLEHTSFENKQGSGKWYFSYRYLVTLIEFFAFSQINAYRLATSISLVAMVNNTAINSHKTSNVSIVSCPLNASQSERNSVTENAGEFDWNPAVQGYILGAGFVGYILTQIPGGRLAEAYGAKPTIVFGLFVSSTGHLLSPFAAWSSSYLMIVIQVLRGLGQGLMTPAYSVLAAKWFPRSERGFLNTLTQSGFPVGALLSGLTAGSMCSSNLLGGWPSVYYIQGSLGLLLCLCTQLLLYESPNVHPRISETEKKFILQSQETDLSSKRPPPPWKEIFTSVQVYAMIFAMFGQFWTITHFLSVHPIFLGTILQFSIKENGFLASISFVFQALNGFIGSWISKWLSTHNYVGVDKVRKGCNLLSSLGYSICILGVYYAGCSRTVSNIFSITAMSFYGFALAGSLITPVDMSPTFAGTLMGFSNTIASAASFIFPALVGIMTNKEQSLEIWNNIFLMCIGVVMSSAIIFCVFGSAEVQPWNYPPSDEKRKNFHLDERSKNEVHDVDHPTNMSSN